MSTHHEWPTRHRYVIGNRQAAVRLALALVAIALARLTFAQTATIVLSGTPAPGTPAGVNFSTFDGSPYLNDAGQVLFGSTLAGTGVGTTNDRGFWRASSGTVALLVREGAAAPGTGAGVNFAALFGPAGLSQVGDGLFTGDLVGTGVTSANNRGFWRGAPGSLAQVAREGSAAPGTSAGVNFTGFSSASGPNQSGQVAFRSDLIGTGVDASNDAGIWQGAPGSLNLVVRKGAAAPGMPAGVTFLGVSVNGGPNDAGQIAFFGTLAGAGVDTSNDASLWRGIPGALTLVAREGSAAPGTPAGVNFGSLFTADLNAAGQLGFQANLTGASVDSSNDSGLWRGAPGALALVVRKGSAAPGTPSGSTFAGFSSIREFLNDSGQMAFDAFLAGPGVESGNDDGIWRGAPGAVQLIARRGQSAPDGNGTISGMTLHGLGAGGQVLLDANFNGTVGGSSDNRAFLIGDGTELVQVARLGDTLAGGQITAFSSGFALHGRSINSFGQVTFLATLSTGTQGIFVWTPRLHWRRATSSSWDTDSNWTLSVSPAQPHEVFIDPAGSLTVFGPTTAANVKALQVGGGTGIATLQLQQGGQITSTTPVIVTSTGVLTGDGGVIGSVVNNGTVLASNLAITGTLTNNALVSGSGRINARLDNSITGEVRAMIGQDIVFNSASNTNNGRFNLLGGRVEFTGPLENAAAGEIILRDGVVALSGSLTNNGRISGRGTLFFDGGLANAGKLLLSGGPTDIYGNVSFTGGAGGGEMINSGGANVVTFYGNVVHNGDEIRTSPTNTTVFFGNVSGAGPFTGTGAVRFEGSLMPGNSPGTMAFGGDLSFGPLATLAVEIGGTQPGTQFDRLTVTNAASLAGTLDVTTIGGFAPSLPGQSFTIVTAASLTGMFENVHGTPSPSLPGLYWTVAYTPTSATLSTSALPGDIDLDGDVDRRDAALFSQFFGSEAGSIWTTGDFNGDAATTLADWSLLQTHLGQTVPSPAALSSVAVPEASSGWLAILGIVSVLLVARRQNRQS